MEIIDDLVKTSEELGKPIIYYVSKIYNTKYYEYILK